MVCASFTDVGLNPAGAMAAALISTVLTLLFYRYFNSALLMKNK